MGLVLWSEKGSGLLATEIDGNFTYLKGLIDALESGVTAESISSISLTTDGFTIVGTHGTTWGPFPVPMNELTLTPRGAWATATAYAKHDSFQNGGDLYLALRDHTSSNLSDDVTFGNVVKLYTSPTSSQVSYDHTASGLAATDVKAAIDNLASRVAALEAH